MTTAQKAGSFSALSRERKLFRPLSHAARILSALEGCEVVICAGMGSRAAAALKAGGVTQIVVTTPGPAEDTVSAFLAGKLAGQVKDFCACHH